MLRTKRWLIYTLALLPFLLAACGSGSESQPAEDIIQPVESGESAALSGKQIYDGLCTACHGPDATGVEGLGKNLVESEFVRDKSDKELVAFIAEGRPATDPANTTGVDMPPRGGNPSLTDEDLAAVIAYLRTLAN